MKIEKETFLDFEYKSTAKDVGTYRRKFKIKRRTPTLEAAVTSTKSALMGGNKPVSVPEAIFIDTMAACSILAEPVDKQGKPNEPDWIDNIVDSSILFKLNEEIKKYDDSFYEEVKDVQQDKPENAEATV